MSSHKYRELKNQIMRFRVVDLHNFLGSVGLHKQGRKSILQRRAIEYLKGNCSQETEMKIFEIYRKMNSSDTADIDLPMVTRNRNLVNYYEQDESESSESSPQRENWFSPEGYHEPIPPTLQFPVPMFIPALVNQSIHCLERCSHETHEGQANNTETEKPSTWTFTLTNPENFQPDLRMVDLPFFERISNISRMKVFVGHPAPKEKILSEFHSEFSLKYSDMEMIKQSKGLMNGRGDKFHIHLRICSFKVPNEENDYTKVDDLPPFLAIMLNSNVCDLPAIIKSTNKPGLFLKRVNEPIDITDFVNERDEYNYVTFLWDPEESDKQFAYTVDLVRKRRPEELVCDLRNKPYFSTERTLDLLKSFLAGEDDDIVTTSAKISVLCPLTKAEMKLPTRSIHCNHLQCFDATSFIQLNEIHTKWICPVCNKRLKFEDIVVDQFILNVIKSGRLPENARFIQVFVDGTWKSVNEYVDVRPKSSVRFQESESESETESESPREQSTTLVTAPQSEVVDESTSDESSEDEEVNSRSSRNRSADIGNSSKKGHVLDWHINALRKKAELEYMRGNRGHSSTQINPSARDRNSDNERRNVKNIVIVDLTDGKDETVSPPDRAQKRKHRVISSSDSGSDTESTDDTLTSPEREGNLSVLGRACLYSVNVRHGGIVDGGGSSLQSYHQANRYSPPCYIIE